MGLLGLLLAIGMAGGGYSMYLSSKESKAAIDAEAKRFEKQLTASVEAQRRTIAHTEKIAGRSRRHATQDRQMAQAGILDQLQLMAGLQTLSQEAASKRQTKALKAQAGSEELKYILGLLQSGAGYHGGYTSSSPELVSAAGDVGAGPVSMGDVPTLLDQLARYSDDTPLAAIGLDGSGRGPTA